MKAATAGAKPDWYEMPADLEKVAICALSGARATPACRDDYIPTDVPVGTTGEFDENGLPIVAPVAPPRLRQYRLPGHLPDRGRATRAMPDPRRAGGACPATSRRMCRTRPRHRWWTPRCNSPAARSCYPRPPGFAGDRALRQPPHILRTRRRPRRRRPSGDEATVDLMEIQPRPIANYAHPATTTA